MANPSKDLQTIYKEYVERELAGLDAAFQEKFGAQRQGEGGQRLQRALGRTTALDIETGGIDPRLSVYESSLAHYGAPIRGELFRLSQSDRDDLTPFAQKLLRERGEALGIPDLAGRLTSDATLPSSEKWASSVFGGISGRDLIIQNLKFESGFLGARFGEEEFQSWLKGARLETKSAGSVPQSKLFETDEKVLRLLSDAQHETGAPTREAFEETTKKWGRVFTEGYYSSFFGEGSRPAEGVTRVYDQLNITRSVLGLAQAKGAMVASFDVHTGTSIDLFSQYAYGQKEFHAAPLDVKMQQHSLETFLDIGRRLTEDRDLTESQKGLLQYIGERQPELKRENARKRLLTAFFGFEEQREGLKPGSLEGQLETFRDVAPSSYNRPYERYNPSTDSWEAAGEIRGRSQRGKEVALKDMDAVVRKLQHRAGSRGGAHVDYQEEWERLKGGVIARYEEQKKLNLGRVGPNIGFSDIKTRETTRGDLFATREEAILSAAASEGVVKARAEAMAGPAAPDGPGRFGRNWKTAGALGLGAIVVGSLFSGSDDEYNYIEGLRHEGMAGSSRRYTTEFGSGYQGPNPWLHPSYNEAQDEPRFSVGRASSMGATYQEHFKKFTEPREENELLSAYASAGTTLHRIEAARKFEAGEIERAEEFVHDPWHGITGHIDLTLAGGVPADVKTVTERGLEQIRRRGAREKHLSQLNFYMYMKGSERGYLEYVSRENPENREIVWAGFDPDLLKRDLARQQAARKTVRRSVRIGLRDEDELPRAAGIERLRAAAADEEGETARDTRFWNFWRLQLAFKEEMAYLEEVKARRRARNAPPEDNQVPAKDDAYNTIEAFQHQGYAGLNRRIFGFGSGWTGKIFDTLKDIGKETKNFAKQFPRTSMMMGAGAVLGAFSHFGGGKEREEPGDGFFTGLLNTAVVGASVIGALAVAPGLIGAAGYSMVAARATKSAGTKSGKGFGSYFGETAWPAVKYGAKMSWESVAAYKRMHTGESAKGLLKDARYRGYDTGTLAQAKRFVSGPVSLGVKAGKHTAHWLKKNWAPMAEEMKDLPAMGLALLTGYEAVEIAAEAADLDLGGVIGGAIGFMAAKYAYMGWHNRSVVKDIVSKTTQQEKILAGAVGTVAAMSTTQMALEALHSTFAYGRYGLKPKELYPLLGGEYAASAARMEENTYDFFFKLADNLESEDLLKKMTAAAARFQMGIEEAKDFHVNMTKDVFTSHLKTELESWRFLSDLPRLEKKPQDAAKVIPKEDRAWYAWHTDNTGFLFPWLKEKIPAHQDQLWGMYNKAKGRAVERVKELQGNRAAVLEYRKRFDRLKTRLGVKLEERRRTGGSKISGHDDDYSHEAFSKKGTTSESRDGVTDFGSGYRGLADMPKKLSAQTGKVKRVIGNTATLSSSRQMKRRRVAMHGAQRNGNAIVAMSQHGNFGKNFNRSYRG